MIPPRQQIHSYHLALSFILLILTIYPYLFNPSCCLVAAYSAEDLDLRHNSIERFDIIEVDDIKLSRTLSVRAAPEQQLHDKQEQTTDESSQHSETKTIPQEAIRKVQFSSLGNRYKLLLSKPTHLIAPDFNVVALDSQGRATAVPYDRNNINVLNGFVEGDGSSSATVSFNKQHGKLMTAQIKTGQDVVIVEPTYLHKNDLSSSPESNITSAFTDPKSKLYEKTMIVYKLSDHEQFRFNRQVEDNSTDASKLFIPEKLCDSVNLTETNDNSATNSPRDIELEDLFKYYAKPGSKNKYNINFKRSKRGIEFISDQSKERTRCTLHLVADYLFYKHVGNGDLQTTINYLLALTNRVNQIYLPTIWETGDDRYDSFSNIGFTVQNITIHQEYTRLSSGDNHYNMQGDKVWGAREFLDNFSRYSPPRHYCLAHLLTYRQFDSPVLGLAYVASTRFGTIGGICSPMQQKGDAYYKHNTGISTSRGINGETLITRQADLVLAHELGHNLGAEHDSNECRPAPSSGGAYLMHPYAVMGFEKNNRFLSNCSRNSIGRVIRRKAPTCFIGVVDNVCGNGVVEEGEECDGGDVGHGHNDPCCDSSCRLTPGSQCSDRHSWCCSKCHIVPAGRPCRPAEEFNCKQASLCDGSRVDCPKPPPVEDGTICIGRGLCRNGDCIPFCEHRELYSCLCTNPADACKLCCKATINGTCVPFDLRGPHLPDGVLCYKGVCEKGRCEQPIQDVVERLWDVIEDINFTTLVKFLRDNIILVVLFLSIPIWCLITHFINEFDNSFKKDVVTAIRARRGPIPHSPFLPHLFGTGSNPGSMDDVRQDGDEANLPLKPPFQATSHNNSRYPPHRLAPGFQAPHLGFQFPQGEEVVMEPRGSIAMNSIELPYEDNLNGQGEANGRPMDVEISDEINPGNSYSTQV